MTTSQESFYDSITGALTPEQALQALALEQSGDTEAARAAEDKGGAPTTTAESDDKSNEASTKSEQQTEGKTQGAADDNGAAQASTTEAEIDPTKAVVLARDGVHTIPYAKLEDARKGEQEARKSEQHWKAQAEAAQQKLATLQEQAQARADAGQAPTATDNMAAQAAAAIEAGVDADLFGDFSEASLKAGIQKLVAQQVAAQVQAHVGKALEPLQAKQQQDAAAQHYDAIYKAHPNADSIVQSAEFKAWVDAHPSAVRNAYWGLFDQKSGGTADQIVEVFDAFKKAAEKPSATPAADAKSAAQAALSTARADPPSSLSSIPGGRAEGSSALDSGADMSGPEMLSATAGMSPQQLEAWMNRNM